MIPALTFRQPWAELLVSGRKTIEIRTWSDSYRGPVWIHAGKMPIDERHDLGELPLGAYVGVAELRMIVSMDVQRWEEWRGLHLNTGPWPGPRYGWVFVNPVRLPAPVDGRGFQRLFFPAAEEARKLEAELMKTRA